MSEHWHDYASGQLTTRIHAIVAHAIYVKSLKLDLIQTEKCEAVSLLTADLAVLGKVVGLPFYFFGRAVQFIIGMALLTKIGGLAGFTPISISLCRYIQWYIDCRSVLTLFMQSWPSSPNF